MPAITLTSPVAYQTLQRNGAGQATFNVTGTYSDGTPTHVAASWNSSWYNISNEVIAGGNFSGTFGPVNAGQGTFGVRWTNSTGTTATAAYVSIGDVFVPIGDSIAAGHFDNAQTYTGTLKASMFQGAAWAELADPMIATYGTHWPLVATKSQAVDADLAIAFINCGTAGSDTESDWQAGATDYVAMQAAVAAANLGASPKAFLMHLGANDVEGKPSEHEYYVWLRRITQSLAADFPGTKIGVACLGAVTTVLGADLPGRKAALSAIRAAQIRASYFDPNVFQGPSLYDISVNDGVHPETDAEAELIAAAWWRCLQNYFYSGSHGYPFGTNVFSRSDVRRQLLLP